MRGRLAALALALTMSVGPGCTPSPPSGGAGGKRVLILGFDGLDPGLLVEFFARGELPNFRRLSTEGTFQSLATSVPPQSPVAWSTFITGLDPGGHGIYDFIHRNPSPPGRLAMLPYLSTSRVEAEGKRLEVGSWAIPLSAGKTELLRRGRAWWNHLADRGVPATLLKIPANFPPEASRQKTLSDMGTPDIRGTYGTFSLYSSDPEDGRARNVSGGIVHRVRVRDDHFEAEIPGPENGFRAKPTRIGARFDVWVDPKADVVKIEVGGEERILELGEWTDWVQISFEMIPMAISVPGIVRFHLMQVRPHLRLYTSPVNIDPAAAALPLSTPEDYLPDLAERAGSFYTQGLPEDTAALTANAIDDESFLELAGDIHEERRRLMEIELARFREGVLFVYFGGADQVSHMFWRTSDEAHPAHQPGPHSGAILDAYRHLDGVLGRVFEELGGADRPLDQMDTTLIVLSDHGFSPFARAVHLNSWLRDEGFLALRGQLSTSRELFADVDWTQTRAYALGLNGLYANLRGRERYGTVGTEAREELLAAISKRLLEWHDPDTGERVVKTVYRREEIYSATYREIAPDLVIGYARAYRSSNESSLGEIPKELLEDNLKKWSGDHCTAADEVPGVLLVNRKLAGEGYALEDLAPTILRQFGIAAPKQMIGVSFLK